MSNKKNFFYYLLPSIIAGVIGIAILPISTFYLDPVDFGIYALLTAFVMPAGSFSSTGSAWVIGGHFFKIDESERGKLIFNILFVDFLSKFLWFMIFWFILPFILTFVFGEYNPYYSFLSKLVLISLLLNAFTASVSLLLIYQRRAKVHAVVEIIGPIVSSLVMVFCLTILKLKTVSLFIGPLIAEITSVFIGLWFLRNYITPNINKNWIVEIIKVGLPAIPTELISLLNNIADRFFIKKWLNLSALGIYAHSLNYRSIFSLGVKAFGRIYSPNAVEKFSYRDITIDLESWIKNWFGLIKIGGVFVILFSYEIVNILTHGKFIEAAPLIPLWYLFIVLYTYGVTYYQFLLANKKNIYLTVSTAIITIFSVSLVAFAVFRFGLIGAVIAALISNFITQYSFKWYAQKHGCLEIGTQEFFFTMIGLVVLYLLNIYLDFTLLMKIGLSLLISSLLIYKYDFIKHLRGKNKITNLINPQ